MGRKSWQDRWPAHSKTMARLIEVMRERERRQLSDIEVEGAVKRFEYTMETALRLMQDYLEAENVRMECPSMSDIMNCACEAGIIKDVDAWKRAWQARNRTAHTYGEKVAEEVLDGVQSEFLPLLEAFHAFMRDLMESTGE